MNVKESGNKIIFTAKIENFTAASNLSVVLNYIYDRDIKNPYSPYQKVNMKYDNNTHLCTAEIDKKYDSATIHYWITTDYGSSNTILYGPDEIAYKPKIDINYAPYVLVIFFGLFLLFEIMMRYGVIRRRSPPEDDEEEETTEKPSEPQK